MVSATRFITLTNLLNNAECDGVVCRFQCSYQESEQIAQRDVYRAM